MSDRDSGHTNGIWKWIAAILIAILLAGAPGIVQAIKAPSQEEVEIIRERQVQILIRLAAIDQQIATAEELILDLQQELRRHEQSTGPSGK